jgi:formate hydrogenlyase subunit 3/multisubunit Na+/H+ antiporter MnhD subunit
MNPYGFWITIAMIGSIFLGSAVGVIYRSTATTLMAKFQDKKKPLMIEAAMALVLVAAVAIVFFGHRVATGGGTP